MMDGVVNWFTKQKEDVAEGEKIWNDIEISILQNQYNGRQGDIGSFADIVSKCLRRNDDLKKFPSDTRLPICSLYHHLKNTAGIAVCLGIDRGCERKVLQKLRVSALLHGIGKLVTDEKGMMEDVLSKINWLEDNDKQFIKTLSPSEQDLLSIADSISSASNRCYEVEFDNGVVRSSDKIFPHILKFSGRTDDVVLGRDKGEEVGHTKPLDSGVYFYDKILGGGLVTDKYNELGEGEIGLLALDIQGIQGFIKEAVKLHALRGGSLIIEEAQKRAEDIIADYVCPEAVLFSGGGNLLAFMPTNKGIRAKVIGEIQNEIEGLSAGGLRCAIVCDDYSLKEVAEHFDEILKDDIFKKLEEKKNEPLFVELPSMMKSDEVCEYCFKRKVTHKVEEDSICTVCREKFVKGRNEGRKVGNYYIKEVLDEKLYRSESLEHIGNNIAVIAIDGNMMGRLFVQTMTPAEYNYKSDTFDKRLKAILKEVITDFSRKNKNLVVYNHEDVDYLGIEPLYVGGDDVLLITNSKIALQFSKELLGKIAKEFTFRTDAIPDYETPIVTLSVGIAMAHYRFPIYFVIEEAEKQLGMAKKAFRKKMELNNLKLHQLPDGAISFTSITSSMPSERRHTFVFPDDNGFFNTILKYIDHAHDKDWRSTLSLIINLETDEESKLNTIKYLHARMSDKDVFEKISKSTGISPLELCEDVSKILLDEDIRTALQSAIPMLWHEGD